MKVAIYQMDIIPGDREANWRKVENWALEVMGAEKPSILVLPEMWTTAYTLPTLEHCADSEKGETIEFLKKLALKHHVHIIGGSIATIEKKNIFNRAVVVNKNGELIYQYDKIHLVPMLNEHVYLQGGKKSTEVFELDGVKFGLIICYDLRFPELVRSLALEGTQMLFILAEWPEARKEHWTILQRARAIENQLFVVSANRAGTYDGVEFCGRSQVISPWGDTLAEGSSDSEDTIIYDVLVEEVKKVRKSVPVFESRVPSLYKYID